MKILKIIALVSLITVQMKGQSPFQQQPFQETLPLDQVSIGIGGGLDYGGFGGNITFYPVKSIGLFAGVGYAFAGAGFNAGVKFRFVPKKPESRVHPFGLVMYGYNAAISVINASQHNKMYFGPTLGGGIDLRSGRSTRGYWSFAILVPIRNPEVFEYMDSLERDYGVEFQIGLLPVGASVGYRFIIN